MKKQELKIQGIPAIVWGDDSEKLFIAVHGNMSNKNDKIIILFADVLTQLGYQVISFDLPEHGDRKEELTPCRVQYCVKDLFVIMEYAKTKWDHINLFACSMGAYFSLLTYNNNDFKQCIFLSPVVDMKEIIENMMKWFDISEERLEREKEVDTPIGQTLYWDYYCYVREHPIISWDIPTSILYGSCDNVSEYGTISNFANQYCCDLMVLEGGEHYFHLDEQLLFFQQWVEKCMNL